MSRYRDQMRQLRNSKEEAYGIKSKEVRAQNTLRTDYYKGYLWRLFLGSIYLKIPDHWSVDYFRNALFAMGCVGVTEYEGVIVPFAYTVSEVNRWKYPTTILSCDEVGLGARTPSVDSEIIYIDCAFPVAPYIGGVDSMIEIYAGKLAMCDGAIDTNLMVSRTPWLSEVDNQRDADNMKALFFKMMSGEPAVFFKRSPKDITDKRSETPFTRLPVKENFVADIVQYSKRQIINEFLTSIGVNNANIEKKERMISSEVESNNEELKCAVSMWQDNVDRCLKKVNKKYNLDVQIKFGGDTVHDSTGFDVDIPVTS